MRVLSTRAVTGTARGRLGIAAAAAVVLGAVLSLALLVANAEGLARDLDLDGAGTVCVIGVGIALALLVVAFGILYGTWRSCNECIGQRLEQLLQVGGGALQYSYRPLGYHDRRSRFVVVADTGELAVVPDGNQDLVTLRGSMRRAFCHDVTAEWPCAPASMEPIYEVRIPNCFMPDVLPVLVTYCGYWQGIR